MVFTDQGCQSCLLTRCQRHNSSHMAPGNLMSFTHIYPILPLLVVFHKPLHHYSPPLLLNFNNLSGHSATLTIHTYLITTHASPLSHFHQCSGLVYFQSLIWIGMNYSTSFIKFSFYFVHFVLLFSRV